MRSTARALRTKHINSRENGKYCLNNNKKGYRAADSRPLRLIKTRHQVTKEKLLPSPQVGWGRELGR